MVTVSHKESKGYGDKCATEEYYTEYMDKQDNDVTVSQADGAVGAISGATYTSAGYQRAVKAAFAAFEIFTGGESND